MQILNVRNKKHFAGIILNGWQAVETALETYGGTGNTFVAQMLRRAKYQLSSNIHWHQNCGYNDFGFSNITVEITVLDRKSELYSLHFIRARSGGEVLERKLAKKMASGQVLFWAGTIVWVKPTDETHFAIDIEEVLTRIRTVVPIEKRADKVAHEMISLFPDNWHWPTVGLLDTPEYSISFGLVDVEERRMPFKSASRSTTGLDYAIISGERCDHPKRIGVKEIPAFKITVNQIDTKAVGYRFPKGIVQKEQQIAVLELSRKIASAFK